MTKHQHKVASTLRAWRTQFSNATGARLDTWYDLTYDFAADFARNSPGFDLDKFLLAAGAATPYTNDGRAYIIRHGAGRQLHQLGGTPDAHTDN